MASKGKIDRYPDVQEVVVSGKRPKSGVTGMLDKYEEASEANPKTKLALDLAPGTGQVMSALDAVNSLRRGNYADAAINAAGVLPPVKWAQKAVRAKKLYSNLRSLDHVNDTNDFAKKEEAAGRAKGGIVKSRGDGCAKRGKTKGKMR
jgi:hypothetical protein